MGYRWDEQQGQYVYEPDEGDDTSPVDYPDSGPGTGAPGGGTYGPEVPSGFRFASPEGYNPGPYAGSYTVPGPGGKQYIVEPARDRYGEPLEGKYSIKDEIGAPRAGTSYGDIRTDEQTGRRYQITSTGSWEWIDPVGRSGGNGGDRLTVSMLPYTQGPTPYQQEQLGLAHERQGLAEDRLASQKDQYESRIQLDREKAEALAEYRQATQDYKTAQLEYQAAIREAQVTADREYKQALIENARADVAEKKRQFEITEARARRAQALAEAEGIARTEREYTQMYGHAPSWAGKRVTTGAPGFGRITPEDIAQMARMGH